MNKVTIGIPTHNRQNYLKRAVLSALAQTYRDIEIVVSNNASTDDTLRCMQEIRDPRLVLLEQSTNIGMVGNFNACLNRATGELFLMLSDDDLLEPTAIERLSAPFFNGVEGCAADNIGITWCPCTIINPAGEKQWLTDGGPAIESPASLIVALWNGIRGPRFSSVLVRTADARTVGGYDGERYGVLCDSPNWAKVALRYKSVVCIDQPLVQYRTHGASASRAAACRDWQRWGEAQFADLQSALRSHGLSTRELRAMRRNLLANLTVTVLLPSVGQPGWFPQMVREVLRAWRCFLTPYVARRLFDEFWKLTSAWRNGRRA
jgi:glycosyltransferase involved in cell wall biosynthesis